MHENSVTHPEGNVGIAVGFIFPIYDDGIAEDVEGLVLSLQVLGLELDPRDVDFVNLPRSAYIIAIYPSGIYNHNNFNYRAFDAVNTLS